MDFSGQRFHLGELKVSHKGRFALALVLGFVGLGALCAALAAYIHPELIKPAQVALVVSSPPLPESSKAEEPPKEVPFRAQPLPSPPLQPQRATIPHFPVAPVLAAPEEVATDFLIADSQTSLDIIAQFKEQEEKRLTEILKQEERARQASEEAALLAQQKAAEEKAQRQKEANERAVAARAEEARRVQQQAIAAKETQARRAREQAIAAKNAEARRAQEQALAANQEQARRAAAQADAQRKAAARAESESRRIASSASLQKTSPPKYPTSARRSGLQGTARIQATVTTSGKISAPRIIASSGHSTLDSAALKAVKKYRFAPARNGLGDPITEQVVIPITFRLQ